MSGTSQLYDPVERFLRADAKTRPDMLRRLLGSIRESLASKNHVAARQALRQVVLPDLDYTSTTTLMRLYRQLRKETPQPDVCDELSASIAVVGSSTTQQLASLLELYLFASGQPVAWFDQTTMASAFRPRQSLLR